MRANGLSKITLGVAAALATGFAGAAPVTYNIDPAHTYPSVEVDHNGGVSKLRGKFNSSTGKIVLDKEAQTGTVDITIDTTSIDFGHDKFNDHIKREPAMLDTAKFPTATYTGKLVKFKDGKPTEVDGSLTLHGVTKPVVLTINSFLCKPNPRSGKEVCGADASGKFNRADFGVDYGKPNFLMDVVLHIEVEASPAS